MSHEAYCPRCGFACPVPEPELSAGGKTIRFDMPEDLRAAVQGIPCPECGATEMDVRRMS